MNVQVSVRLDERLVERLDDLVRSGEARSRAEVVESALERELRRRLYAKDVAVYSRDGEDPETEDFLEWTRARAYPTLEN